MKDNTNTANTVTNILRVRESNEKLPLAIQYGIDNENIGKEKFKTTVGVEVLSCGLFVDEKIRFLGASPDGLIGSDSILEIKCPFGARDQTIEEAVTAKKISYCTIDPTQYAGESDKRIILKSTHVYMYVCKCKASYILQSGNSVILLSTQKRFEIWDSSKR
jgi:hypothetical protein